MRKRCRRTIREPGNVRLALQPWRVLAVFAPLEAVLAQIESTGCVDSAQGKPVFREDGGWFETAPAVGGIVDYMRLAAERHGWTIDLRPLKTIVKRLGNGAPIAPEDIDRARTCIDECKRVSMRLTTGEAQDLLTTIRIRNELEMAA